MAERRIGMIIRRARERRRWTQADLAKEVGVSRASVDAWENDRTYPRNRIGALEQVLGIRLDDTPDTSVPSGPLDDLLPPRDRWEADVLANPDLPDELRRRFIEDYRRARSEAQARRQDPGRNGAQATGVA